MSYRIALLIDAENISHRDLPDILAHVARQGKVVLKAVYGDWRRQDMHPWHEAATQHGFKIRHQQNLSNTKNSSDMKLMMDAMEILFYVPVDSFCLVTNDADYIPLCDKIHESGKHVIGVGYQQASDLYIRACDQFIFLNRPPERAPKAAPASEANGAAPPPRTDELVPLLTAAITLATKDGWATLSAIGSMLRQLQPGFQTSTYGHATLSKLLRHLPDVVELQLDNTPSRARLKQQEHRLSGLVPLLAVAITLAPHTEDGWATLSAVDSALRELQPGFQTDTYGHATLSKLLRHLPDVVELQVNKKTSRARLKQQEHRWLGLRHLLARAFAQCATDGGWVSLSALGTTLRELQPGFKTGMYGHASLSKLLRHLPDVELATRNNVLQARWKA